VAVTVREGRASDFTRLAEIYQQSLDARDSSMEVSVTPSYFQDLTERFYDREVLLVVEDEGCVQGWGAVKRYSDRVGYRVACETSIYLDRTITGRGYGGKLQGQLMERAASFGYHHVVAKIWASNDGSIRFHQRFGFELVGVQKEVGFMAGKWCDVAILQCILAHVPPFRPELS
jgi:L-amino acid N-acyltransferase YncA